MGFDFTDIGRIKRELESLGYETFCFDSSVGEVVVFDYTLEVGSRRGEIVKVGVGFQERDAYPDYPPHWIFVSPPIDDGRGGIC